MDKNEREETTKYAKGKIETFLKNHDYVSALFLSSIYLNIRLRSLLTDRLLQPKNEWKENEWKEISRMLTGIGKGFNTFVNLCNRLGLLEGHNPEDLKGLWNMRNKIAHESELWKSLSERDEKEIRRLCKSAIEFLEKTNS